jgi:hypothetical protein
MNANIKAVAAFVFLLNVGAVFAGETGLSKRVVQQDGWATWQVPMSEGAGMPCCLEWHQRDVARTQCDLDRRSWNISRSDDDLRPATADNLSVYAHVSQGRIDKVRAYAASCAIRDADKIRHLDPVQPADSVALLEGIAGDWNEDRGDTALASMAMHADKSAMAALERLTGSSHPRKLREQALFWMGQARGADGATFIERVATAEADPELRANAIFALSQSHGTDAYASIRRIAQNDASEHVREQGYFWMAQMGDKRAKDDIFAAIASEKSDNAREQAVFALSQLKEGDAEAALIALVRGSYPRKVKEQALFWLGQSGSTQAIDFLDEVLTRSSKNPASG